MITAIGRIFISLITNIGKVVIFALRGVLGIFSRPFYFRNVITHIIDVGYFSLPVIGMTAIFTGAVLALQSYTGFSRFSASESSIATIVVLSITRELGPVLAGLMVTSRIGASIAAEIATMKVTEQIDALTTLATDPIKYLVTPRIIASVLMLPVLVLISDVIGIMGGYLVSVYKLGFNANLYIQNSLKYLEFQDVASGLVKAAIFGFIIAIMGCYSGFYSDRGARGVGNATTTAVVSSSMLILLFNYLTTALFFAK
ncbi:putative phospholipid ABC transporter permease protein MlaE [Candidatus Arcanobacter lacustris]|jgi:phospholipid/cholesterol/gamma-HCH transport system permease protein|uniref:Putative phospholipid ABC transporter permease protein MlaE n=1 Tax=Candidatus Arcanibacter lacustris TaxID=1607817 RepID=A0A0F5MPA9_9RICK|nr:putative phospholipid ABC transporter permease protein MlaE [Candidatus Arcanobacter lacustris]